MARDKTVWHVADAEYLYSLDLSFVKWPTGVLETPEDEAYCSKIESVKAREGGLEVLGVYVGIICSPSANTAMGRGYLVDDHFKSAPIALIAQLIRCGDIPLVRKALRTLEVVGLMERVELPDFASVDPGSQNRLLMS